MAVPDLTPEKMIGPIPESSKRPRKESIFRLSSGSTVEGRSRKTGMSVKYPMS